jgi:proton-coupled amino acid transporter
VTLPSTSFLTMSSPSQPLNIKLPPNPIRGDVEGIPSSYTPSLGTPDLRALRAQYGGTPPLPNIPLRNNSSAAASRRGSSSVLQPLTTPFDSSPSPLRPGPQAIGGLSASRQPVGASSNSNSSSSSTAAPAQVVDLDDLPAEEKVKVLGRHLVQKERRIANNGKAPEGNSTPGSVLEVPSGLDAEDKSGRSSYGATNHATQREESDAFPIPYDAPGADVT